MTAVTGFSQSELKSCILSNSKISVMQNMTYPFEYRLFHSDDFHSVFGGKFFIYWKTENQVGKITYLRGEMYVVYFLTRTIRNLFLSEGDKKLFWYLQKNPYENYPAVLQWIPVIHQFHQSFCDELQHIVCSVS